MPETAEQILPATGDETTWTPVQRSLIIAMGLVWKDRNTGQVTLAPRHVVEAFLYQCKRTGLDPLNRQVYSIARWDTATGGPKWTTQVAIDGFRVIAERHGQYAGQGDIEWLTDDGRWVDVFVKGKPGYGDHPLAARATVYRHDFTQPLRAVANWDGYAQSTSFWNGGLGPNQIAKCAEALALRKGFPQDLSGLYIPEEMEQAGAQQAITTGQEVSPTEQSAEAPTQQQGSMDPQVRDSWWQRASTVQFLGVKGSGDGGLRDLYEEARVAGVLSWPIGDGEEQTFREFLRLQATRLPEQAEEVQDAEVEDQPMALADPVPAAAPAAAPQQVSEPLPPAPAGQRDEAEPEVQEWKPAGAEPEGWALPDDQETPF